VERAGATVRDDLMLERARLVDDPVLAGRLEDAYGSRVVERAGVDRARVSLG